MAGGRLTREPQGRDISRSIEVSETQQNPGRGENVRTVRDVALAAGVAKKVAHTLGRVPQEWIALRPRVPSGSVTATYPVERAIDSKYVTLESPGDVTIDLLVW